MSAKLQDLGYYTGTEGYHRLTLIAPLKCTDGVKYVADDCGAYWLVDAIASYQHKLRAQDFQSWSLDVNDGSAVLSCTDGNDNVLATQAIEFTDFPQSIKFFVTNGVLMLTSEY